MEKYKDFFTPVAILAAGAMISFSILLVGGVDFALERQDGEDRVAAQPDGTGTDTGQKEDGPKPQVAAQDHTMGNPDAPVTLVEFSDFQCPFCRQFHPTVQQIFNAYEGNVRWVYKHFPLDQIHPQARPAAEASECVAEQGGNDAFWAFADALFQNQGKLGGTFYEDLAWEIGLDKEKFRDCFATRKYKDKVEANYQEGVRLGVNGTPGSFVNAVPVRGALPYENIKAIVEGELTKLGIKNQPKPTGTQGK